MAKAKLTEKTIEESRKWHLFSARGEVTGRLATKVAHLLMGKHKRTYMPNIDAGDYVVVTDAKEIVLTGNKETQKTYQRYSGYPGGRKITPVAVVRQKFPQRILEYAVKGMLPDNKLKSGRMGRLKIFAGSQHPYESKLQISNSK